MCICGFTVLVTHIQTSRQVSQYFPINGFVCVCVCVCVCVLCVCVCVVCVCVLCVCVCMCACCVCMCVCVHVLVDETFHLPDSSNLIFN